MPAQSNRRSWGVLAAALGSTMEAAGHATDDEDDRGTPPPSLCSEHTERRRLAPRVITGQQLAAITRAMVRITTQHSGRGATEAKAYQCDDFLFCVLKGGLTALEANLLEHGEGRLVRDVRLRFQETNGAAFVGAVEEITGQRVLTYESQVLFSPDYTVEIFVLEDGELPNRPSIAGPG